MNTLSFEEWKSYLKNNPESKKKRSSLTELGAETKNDLKESLEANTYKEAIKNRRMLAEQQIFKLLCTTQKKLDFSWTRKPFYNEERGVNERVIYCRHEASDYIFSSIKDARGVASMHGTSIDNYLIPMNDEIRALKTALNTSQPQASVKDLSYQNLKTNNCLQRYDELMKRKESLLQKKEELLPFSLGENSIFGNKIIEIEKDLQEVNAELENIENQREE